MSEEVGAENPRDGPIGGDCDKSGCKRAAYRRVRAVKTCGDHEEWAREWYEERREEQ